MHPSSPKRSKSRHAFHVVLFTRNTHLQDSYVDLCQNDCHIDLICIHDYSEAVERLTAVESRRIDAIITDTDILAFKLLDYVNTSVIGRTVLCIILVAPVNADNGDSLTRVQSHHGVNIFMSSEHTCAHVLECLIGNLQKGSKIDSLFKDLKETHNHDKEHPFLPIFEKKAEQLTTEMFPVKRAIDIASVRHHTELDLNVFISKPKQYKQPTTVAGLDKKQATKNWRDYLGGEKGAAAAAGGGHSSGMDFPPNTMHLISTLNAGSEPDGRRYSTVSSVSTDNYQITETTELTTIDKLKLQQEARKRISFTAKEAPANIQIDNLAELNLQALNINLAERELLQRGMHYQDSGDFQRALHVFLTAGLRTSKPYISRILLGNLHYAQGDYMRAIREYAAAIEALKTADDSRCSFIARFNRGISYFRVGNDHRGLEDMLRAARIDRLSIPALEILTVAQRRVGLHSDAMDGLIALARRRKEASRPNCIGSDDVGTGAPNRRLSVGELRKLAEKEESISNLVTDSYKPEAPIIKLTIQPITNLTLKDLSVNYKKKFNSAQAETVAQSSSASNTLESFKILRGISKDLSAQLFDCPSSLQTALLSLPNQRNRSEIRTIITEGLNLFPYFKSYSRAILNELAKTVRYVPIMAGTNLFNQFEEIEYICLLLSGKISYCMESSINGVQNIAIGTLEGYHVIGAVDMLFCSDNGNLNNVPKVRYDLMKDIQNLEEDDHRTFQPKMFLTYNVSTPSELLFIGKADFDRYLVDEALVELHKMIDVINASKVFIGWSQPEKIRLARMGRIQRFQAGQVVLDQGERPLFLYIMISGMCKVYKKPNDVDVILRRLKEAKFKAEQFDLKYAFHHRLRGVLSRAPEEEIPPRLRGQATVTLPEHVREQLRNEILKLESTLAKKPHQDSKSGKDSGGFTEIVDLYWPRIFGESCVLDSSDTGVSLGRIVAATSCEMFMLHKTQIQTFQFEERFLESLQKKGVKYPDDEVLAKEERLRRDWTVLKKELLKEIRTKI